MKRLKKTVFIGVPLLLLIGYLLFTFIRISQEEEERKVEGGEIVITNPEYNFIDKKEFLKLVTQKIGKLDGASIDSINGGKIEALLQKNPFVENVQVYRSVNNRYKIEITQRTPVLRVWTDTENYFLDKEGFQMPTGSKYPALVHLYRGAITKKFATKNLLKFQKYLDKNPFWKEMIDYVVVDKKGELTLYLRVESGKILFGTVENIAPKLEKLLLFIKKVGKHNGMKMYKSIDLRFNNQVVVKKK